MFLVAILFFSCAYAAANAVWPSFYAEMFNTKVRFSGLAIGTQLGFLMAGFAPAIVTAMGGTAGGWVPISIFTAVIRHCGRLCFDGPGDVPRSDGEARPGRLTGPGYKRLPSHDR